MRVTNKAHNPINRRNILQYAARASVIFIARLFIAVKAQETRASELKGIQKRHNIVVQASGDVPAKCLQA